MQVPLARFREDHPGPLTRREALGRLGAGALLALGMWPGSLSLKAGTGEAGAFRFVVLNDTHLMTPQCGPWLEQVVRKLRAERPDFCLLNGDMTEEGSRRDLAVVRDIFRGLGAPVYTVIGNHDHGADDDAEAYNSLFPRRLNYWFEHRGWQFVGLDTTDGRRWEKTLIQPGTFHWLAGKLGRIEARKPTVLFTHFPLGEAVSYRPANTDELLERFRHFNLKAILSGHWHGFTLRWQESVFALTNRCCALKRGNHDRSPAKGYLVCEARDGCLTYRFVECRPAILSPSPLTSSLESGSIRGK
jgi:predicted phosphodiesterase